MLSAATSQERGLIPRCALLDLALILLQCDINDQRHRFLVMCCQKQSDPTALLWLDKFLLCSCMQVRWHVKVKTVPWYHHGVTLITSEKQDIHVSLADWLNTNRSSLQCQAGLLILFCFFTQPTSVSQQSLWIVTLEVSMQRKAIQTTFANRCNSRNLLECIHV